VKSIKNAIGDKWRELVDLNGFDPYILVNYLEYDLTGHNRSIITSIMNPIKYVRAHRSTWFPDSLKWCPKCIKKGYHSWFHQFSLVKNCPIDHEYLKNSCPQCLNEIPFLLSDKGLSDPFTCKCGYKLADFSVAQWSDWNYGTVQNDETIIKWLEKREGEEQERHLFFPQSVSLDLFSFDPLFTGCFRDASKIASQNEYYLMSDFKNDMYIENLRCFKIVDRYIKRKFLYRHRKCLQLLEQLRKPESGAFLPICPYAYAYVFWKHTLLQTDHFYQSAKGNTASTRKGIGGEIATQLVERYIIDLKNRLLTQTNFKKIDNRKMFHWIMNRVTTEICLNYFYQWKDIAQANSEGERVPDWVQVNKMLEKSLPKIIFRHQEDIGKKQVVEVIIKSETKQVMEITGANCVTRKKAVHLMKSFTPQYAAIRVYENPTDENKMISEYIDQYVSKLKI